MGKVWTPLGADKYFVFLEENTKDIDTVCELGAGVFKNFENYKCPKKIGVELIPAYVIHREYTAPDCEPIVGNAMDFEKQELVKIHGEGIEARVQSVVAELETKLEEPKADA